MTLRLSIIAVPALVASGVWAGTGNCMIEDHGVCLADENDSGQDANWKFHVIKALGIEDSDFSPYTKEHCDRLVAALIAKGFKGECRQ